MSDDIVARLRDVGFCGVKTQQEAADEIERLRIKCEKWRKLAYLAHECVLYGERDVSEFLDMYEATIRGGHA